MCWYCSAEQWHSQLHTLKQILCTATKPPQGSTAAAKLHTEQAEFPVDPARHVTEYPGFNDCQYRLWEGKK